MKLMSRLNKLKKIQGRPKKVTKKKVVAEKKIEVKEDDNSDLSADESDNERNYVQSKSKLKLTVLEKANGQKNQNIKEKKLLHKKRKINVKEKEKEEEEEEKVQVDELNSSLDEDAFSDENDTESELQSPSNLYSTENQKRKKGNLDDNNDEATGKYPTKKIKKENDLYKPPTVEELNQLRETENLFHSNLFRLQIEEILAEVKLKEKYKKQLSVWFTKFKQNVESLKETNEFELNNFKAVKKWKAKIPKLDVPINEKGSFKYLKPSKIDIIGSYPLETSVGPNIIVDVMIEMPSELFHKHDYQNYRYLRKRALYLSYIAANIKEDVADKLTFIGESWTPKLKLIPSGSLNKRVTIHIHVAAEPSSFKLNRFLPEKNGVRQTWYFNDNSKSGELIPTPMYNSNILHDLTMSESNSKCLKIIGEYPNLRDGIVLLKIWLRQRQSVNANDAFSGHILTMFVLFLLFEKKLNTYMSSYQIIRNVWNNLAQMDLTDVGISVNQEADAKERVKNYKNFYDCVFLDSSGFHNLTANISANNYSWIRSEAELAVKCLDNPSVNSFQILFMKRLPFYTIFDHIICLHDTESLQQIAEEKITDDRKLDLGLNKRSNVTRMIIEVLKEGLGKRVLQIYVKPDDIKEWEINENPPSSWKPIYFGVQLNPDYCFNIIDKGPHANLPEAEDFKKFWGQKSELRRFQDGTICEAVVWAKENTLSEKRIICKKIVTYLLKGKFDLSKDQFFYGCNQIEEFLRLQKTSITKFNYGTGEEATLQLLKVFSDLEKKLISLQDLPLGVTGVQPFSPVFRYTDVFPPLATVYKADEENTCAGKHCLLFKEKSVKEAPKYAPVAEATIQLSTSGKWPDELEAVRKTKGAFHIQIAECLRKEHGLQAKATMDFVNVFTEGFVFRMRVAHQKEIGLMKQEMTPEGVIKYRDTEESIELEKKLFHLPKLTGALYGLYSQQPSFGPTCCLAKRWLSAQLIDDFHIPDIVVELILASIYLSPEPYQPAQMPQVGFLRFLEFLSSGQWTTEPVIVNFNNEMMRDQVIAVENLFGTCRDTLPPLFITTPYDKEKSVWSKKSPSNLILNRLKSLAKEALKLVELELSSSSTIIWKPIFKPPLSGYDCLIYVKPEFNPRRYQYFDLSDSFPQTSWHPYKFHTEQKLPIVEFNPVQLYLQDLRSGYGEFVLFFHDTYGGEVIGVLINPSALEKKDFKVANVNCRKIGADGKLELNVDAMIQDFYIVGGDLVDRIEVQSQKI